MSCAVRVTVCFSGQILTVYRGQQTFSGLGQTANMSGFVGPEVSVTASRCAADVIVCTRAARCIQTSQDHAVGCGLRTPELAPRTPPHPRPALPLLAL